MIGVLVAAIVTLGAIPLGRIICRRWLDGVDPAAQVGICGLIGLGAAGTAVFFVGLFSVSAALLLVAIGLLVSLPLWRGWPSLGFSRPSGAELLFPILIAVGLLMSLAGVLAPSTPNDWDSLAYHLAVPKLWLEAGRIHEIPFIHQSNFPFAVDSLFLIGLKLGGQAGAKAFVWMITLLGTAAIFGLSRQRYGSSAAWWSALSFSTVPIVLWQSGTAYIDVAHGLYAGLGLIFACWWLESDEVRHVWLAAVLLSLAAGTKYTGLQTIAVAGLVVLIGSVLLKRNLKPALIVGLVSIALASPWYIKNVIWKDSPVFPFFYSKLGGEDWDARRAEIYTREQNTFGVGRASPPDGGVQIERAGHSILGLAYQPGRYVNPFQTQGGGDPMGAVGIAIIGALMLGLAAGQRGRFERSLLVAILASLAIWIVLTQQSRYIVALAVPLAMMAGQLTTRKGFGPLMGGLAAIQAIASIYLLHSLRFVDQMEAVTGKVTTAEYQAARIPFYIPAQEINKLGKTSKVALYDEVFGLVLDVPYYWANPGHGTMIPYDAMESGADYADQMRKMGFSHIYMNLSPTVKDPVLAAEILAALGGTPLSTERAESLRSNWEQKFTFLVVDAVIRRRIEPTQVFGSPERPRGVLLRILP